MRRILTCLAFAGLTLLAACSCRKAEPGGGQQAARTFAKGADISWVTWMEARGFKFYNAAGQERECTALLRETGADAVRLRVWVDPADGWCGKEDVVVKAKRAQALGMDVMIDFHYSDSWADPGKQPVPAAWQAMGPEAMAQALAAHTTDVLQALKGAGVDVKWVQVGNETTNGMLWESGRVAGTNAGEFVRYFDAGRKAVKSVFPQAQVILHLDNGWDLPTLNWFLTLMKGKGLEYDVLGLSLYPSYWQDGAYPDWTPKTKQFVDNLPVLYRNYGKPVILVEFGMPASEPAKGRAALEYILHNTRDYDYFQGVFFWEPEAEAARVGYPYGAFADGKPTEAMEPFGE